jgi:hypothetical protein
MTDKHSDTPRVDSWPKDGWGWGPLARELERELAAALEAKKRAQAAREIALNDRAVNFARACELEQRCAELEQDAERYRWIRNNPTFMGWDGDYLAHHIDMHVDDAMKERGE